MLQPLFLGREIVRHACSIVSGWGESPALTRGAVNVSHAPRPCQIEPRTAYTPRPPAFWPGCPRPRPPSCPESASAAANGPFVATDTPVDRAYLGPFAANNLGFLAHEFGLREPTAPAPAAPPTCLAWLLYRIDGMERGLGGMCPLTGGQIQRGARSILGARVPVVLPSELARWPACNQEISRILGRSR